MANGDSGNRIDIVSTAEGDFVVSPSAEGEPNGHATSSTSDTAAARGIGQGGGTAPRRPWIGIHFDCCDVYQRVYRKPDDDHYIGFCPKCGRRIRLRVGADGVNAKFFRATPG